MATIFSKIIAGQIPCYKIAENKEFFAFLDINPLKAGHTLVVPKREVNYIFDLEPDELGRMHQFAQIIALAQKKAISCQRIAVAVLGLEVPHAHIHLVPIETEKDVLFSNTRVTFTEKEFQAIADGISKYLPLDLK